MSERMFLVGPSGGTMKPVKEQNLIANIDERIDSLAHHGRAAGPVRRDSLRSSYQNVAD